MRMGGGAEAVAGAMERGSRDGDGGLNAGTRGRWSCVVLSGPRSLVGGFVWLQELLGEGVDLL